MLRLIKWRDGMLAVPQLLQSRRKARLLRVLPKSNHISSKTFSLLFSAEVMFVISTLTFA